jgi:hypothetical protein
MHNLKGSGLKMHNRRQEGPALSNSAVASIRYEALRNGCRAGHIPDCAFSDLTPGGYSDCSGAGKIRPELNDRAMRWVLPSNPE